MEEVKAGGEGLLDEIREIVRQEVSRALAGNTGINPGPGEAGVLAGNLKYFRLPEILHMVSMQSLTGRLSLTCDGRYVDIYFRYGGLAYATGETRSAREQLGSILVSMGRITGGALEAAVGRCRETSERLGKVLIDDGYVTKEDIRSALTKQTERSVYKAMAWADGTFTFELCELPDFVEDVPLNIKVEGLILEGLRRIEEIRVFTEKITSLELVFEKPEYSQLDVNGMDLKADERLVLEAVDGRRDVMELMRLSGLDEFRLMRALYVLLTAGIIKKSGSARKGERTQYL